MYLSDRLIKVIIISSFIAVFLGCASSKMTKIRKNTMTAIPIKSISIAPSGGILADAIGVELFNKGSNIIDTRQTSDILVRMNLDEMELTGQKALSQLKDKNIDAILWIWVASGQDGKPDSASVKLISNETFQMITGVAWQNGWGGQSGSIADRSMRKGVTEAAQEIAQFIMNNIKQK